MQCAHILHAYFFIFQITMNVQTLQTTTASTNVPILLVHFSAIAMLDLNWMKMGCGVNVSARCYISTIM